MLVQPLELPRPEVLSVMWIMGKGVRSLTRLGQQFFKELYFFSLVLQLLSGRAPGCCQNCGVFSWFMVHGLYLRRNYRRCVSDTFPCGSKWLLWAGVLSSRVFFTCSDSGYSPLTCRDCRKDCLENASILLPCVILWKHFERMWQTSVAWSVPSFICVWSQNWSFHQ